MWASIKDFYIDFKSYIVRLESINFFMFFLIFIFSFLTIESFNKIFLKEISIYYYYSILLGIYFFYVYGAYFLRRFLYSNKNILIFNYKDFSLSQLVKSDIKKLENQLGKKSDNLLIGKYFYSFTDLDLKLYLFRYNIETILYIYFDEEKKSFAVKKFIHPNIEKSRKIEYFYNAIFNNDDNNYNLEDINYNLFITYLYLNNTKNINIKSIFEYTLVNYNNIFYNDNYIKILYLLFINYINDISFGSNDFDIKKTKEILKQKSINQDFLQNLYDFFLKNVNEKIDNGELNKMNLSSVKFIIRLYFEFNYLFYLMFDKKLQNFSELLFSIQKIIDNLGNNNKIIGLNRFIIYNFIIYKNEKINIFRELQKFILKNSDNFYKKGENFLNNETNFYDFLIKNFLDDKKDNIEKLDVLVYGFYNKLLNEGEINNLNRKKKTLKNFIKIFNI